MVLVYACTPDLRETVGPRIAEPNVAGLVERGDIPVGGIRVRLEDAAADTTVDSDRTGGGGRFAFAEVGPGTWAVRVDSSEPGDFASVTYEFIFAAEDTSLEIPTLDLSMADMELSEPEDGEVREAPDLFDPLEFAWDWAGEADTLPRFRVRFYTLSGEQVWFSEKVRELRVVWNGIANSGDHAGGLVGAGDYRWRLRVYGQETLELTTGYRPISFDEWREATPMPPRCCPEVTPKPPGKSPWRAPTTLLSVSVWLQCARAMFAACPPTPYI